MSHKLSSIVVGAILGAILVASGCVDAHWRWREHRNAMLLCVSEMNNQEGRSLPSDVLERVIGAPDEQYTIPEFANNLNQWHEDPDRLMEWAVMRFCVDSLDLREKYDICELPSWPDVPEFVSCDVWTYDESQRFPQSASSWEDPPVVNCFLIKDGYVVSSFDYCK